MLFFEEQVKINRYLRFFIPSCRQPQALLYKHRSTPTITLYYHQSKVTEPEPHRSKPNRTIVHRAKRTEQGSVEAVGFCATHPWVATGGTDGGLKVWDSVSGTCRHTCMHPAAVTRLEWHPAAPVSVGWGGGGKRQERERDRDKESQDGGRERGGGGAKKDKQ